MDAGRLRCFGVGSRWDKGVGWFPGVVVKQEKPPQLQLLTESSKPSWLRY
jgi:hypothetical protein